MILVDGEIEEATAVEIGILQPVHIATEQAIEAIDVRVFGTDVSISPGKVFLEAGGSNAWGGKFHTRHRAGWLGARGHGVEHAGPGVVGVAGQADQPLALGEGGLQDGLAFDAVAIPSVEVVGDFAGFCEQGLLGGRQLGKGSAGGQLLQRSGIFVEQAWIAGVQQQLCGHGHRLHQHLLTQHLPGGIGSRHLLLQPGQLGVADHVAARIAPGLLHRGEHQLLGDSRR